jgi:hypothetical protein
MLRVAAFAVDQLSVAEPPEVIVAGFAAKLVIDGAGA